MKVLIANKFFFRNGGAEVVLFQERAFLKQLGHEVVDFSMRDSRNISSNYADYFVAGYDYRASGWVHKARAVSAFMHSWEAVRRIGVLIDRHRPDVLHCHNIYHQLTPSIIGAAKQRAVPVVLTLHDYKPVCPAYTRLREGAVCSKCLDGTFRGVIHGRCAEGSLARSALLYAEAVLQRWLGSYERVDKFIAPSDFMRRSVLTRFREDQVDLLPNGVDLAEISQSFRDDNYVLYLGRLSAEKGIETLLRAHAASQARWALRVAGTGPLETTLRSTYPRAEYLGHLTGGTLSAAVANASAVVVPSEWYENCPMSVLEAMAYGKPVVAARIGGIPELVEDGISGLLFESGNIADLRDTIESLMSNPARRNEMGMAARRRVEQHFSLERHNSQLLSIYDEVLKKAACK